MQIENEQQVLQKALSNAVVQRAWAKIEAKGSNGGIDKVNIQEYKSSLQSRVAALREKVFSGEYVPEPYQVFYIEKRNGSFRPLAMLTLDDKLLQNCLYLIYEESIEKKFVNTSYAYRSDKGHKKAIGRIGDYLMRKYKFVLPVDIKSYFDTINRQLLLDYCREYFPQPEVQKLLAMWILTGGVYQGRYITGDIGIAQGGILSPVLSNIYLTGYDREMEKRKFENVRYSDNILLLGKTEQELNESIEFTYRYLSSELSLTLNPGHPLPIETEQGFDFCGIRFFEGRKLIIQEKFKSMCEKLESLIQQLPAGQFIRALTQHRDGILRYYSNYDTAPQLEHLDTIMLNCSEKRVHKMLSKKQLSSPKEAGNLMRSLPLFTEAYKQELLNIAATAFRRYSGSAGISKNYNPRQLNTSQLKAETPGAVAEKPGDYNRADKLTGITNQLQATNKETAKKTVKENTTESAETKQTPGPQNSTSDVLKTAGRKVQGRRLFYNRVYAENLDLFVNTSYSQLGKSGDKIILRQEGKVKLQVHAVKVRNIVIAGNGISISTDVIRFCCQKNIRISFHDSLGKPFANITPDASPLAGVSRAQTDALYGERGKYLAKSLIAAKIKNQHSAIKFFTKNIQPGNLPVAIATELERLDLLAEEVLALPMTMEFEVLRGKIFGIEGSAAVSYWKMVKALIPSELDFTEREHQNAENPVNILLNYGYGILYSRLHTAISVAGLNPFISFLHAEQKNKPTLVFDVIEMFRAPIVDRTILAFLRKKIKFKINNGQLTDETRKKLATKVLIRINSEVQYRGKRLTLSDIMLQQMKELIKYIQSEEKVYRPYLFKW